ncbi:DNA repair protein RecN [Thiomonas intermedia]|uniref:DNA repair protein RecN n=1 Tax=Thiomonas intermedia TaxID=926 RepID=UPI0009A5238D|nr:DNA repair protein RecN [Thiomonas intermedia]
MLLHLHLRDFVIVPELDIDLAAGFTVLTGETGAGKSILIDALKLALGERADSSVVRAGALRAEISAEFSLTPPLAAWLEAQGFAAEADTLLLRRVIDAQGKSRGFLNGSPATAAQLKAAGEWLVDIHGQHAYQGLVRREVVTQLLDGYAGAQDEARAVAQAWAQWRDAHAALQQARRDAGALDEERERLQWQCEELDRLQPQFGDWEALEAEHKRLAHVSSLLEDFAAAAGALDGEDQGVLPLLAQAQQALERALQVDAGLQPLVQQIEAAQTSLSDLSHELRRLAERTEADPQRLAELDVRLSGWMSLARKHRVTAAALPQTHQTLRDKLQQLNLSADLPALESAEQQALAALQKVAAKLSARRRKAAQQLAKAVQAAMQELGMPGGRFDVALVPLDAVGARGAEAVELQVAAHPGAELRALGKVASGGELSRIALAVAVTTSALQDTDTLIFDEVDAGIGGAVAQTVGRLLRRLGGDRQVLAVTHLAQVAACAQQHFAVRKHSSGQQTASLLDALAPAQRPGEIARMLGGNAQSDAALEHARELLAACDAT